MLRTEQWLRAALGERSRADDAGSNRLEIHPGRLAGRMP